MHIRQAGYDAVLIECDNDDALTVARALTQSPLTLSNIVPAERTVFASVEPGRGLSHAAVTHIIERYVEHSGAEDSAAAVTIPVDYSGCDLDDVAKTMNMTVEEVIDRHTRSTWRAAFIGFAPGFTYLVRPDDPLTIPRRNQSRTTVPEGSVAFGGHYCAIYPRQSPGGWQLIGHTQQKIWDIDRDPPALITPGATVQFVRAT